MTPRLVAIFYLSGLLAACTPNSGGNNGTPPPPKESGSGNGGGDHGGGGKKPAAPLAWGELECQKSKTCTNRILNLSHSAIERFIDSRKSEGSVEEDTDTDRFRRAFNCGRRLPAAWDEHFPGLTTAEFGDHPWFAEFMEAVIDPVACVPAEKWKSNLQQYLEKYARSVK